MGEAPIALILKLGTHCSQFRHFGPDSPLVCRSEKILEYIVDRCYTSTRSAWK